MDETIQNEVNPHRLAVMFLSNFINAPDDELGKMDITFALSGLIAKVVSETVDIVNQDKRILH